ncbi:MAG TPA: FAD-dependent oxidoreductase [Frankiaceae bacterium]|jgi:succinate dehydrogenase/fumarate reductase flavoprotein subunit|nr:FAD-dependent oxidoreductase [Frankiaceae bacterium]
MITSRPAAWDKVVDVVVLGSGAAGLTAATLAHDGGAEVLLLEKSDLIGGTTAVSGGMPWIPLNKHLAELGVSDTRDEAITYIRRLSLGTEPDPALIETYVDTAAEMLDYLETKTPLKMSAPPGFSDYYADQPGGKPEGRSVEPVPFDAGAELGEWAPRVRTGPHLPWLTMEEGGKFLTGRDLPDANLAQQRQDSDTRVLGAALAASLFKGLLDRGVAVQTGTAAQELIVVDGAVVGVRVSNTDGHQYIGARRGVVLTTGGFEWNKQMVAGFIGQEIMPLSPPYNEGDGHRMAMEAGAQLANMMSFWGQPALLEPGFEIDGRAVPQMASIRSMPGVMIVNRYGDRFVNEGATYQDLPKAMATYDPVAVDFPNRPPTWIVFDQRVRDTAVVLPTVLPGQPTPDWIFTAPTIGELADQIGAPPERLEATVERWNSHVTAGEDPDFHRGTFWWEAFMTGGPTPEACLRPVAKAPFYAMELINGTIGTNGGARIDATGRVLGAHGVIPGLYAAGNASAGVFGRAYPGGGGTIGPALTFGYLAGRAAAAEQPREV